MTQSFDLFSSVNSAVSEALIQRGRVNVLIVGKTGVGKSTLVNALFQGNLARTGQGRPVTQNTREITKSGIPVTIFDTRGLELGRYEETADALSDLILERNSDPDPFRHIHVAWLCISEDSRRVEQADERLLNMIARQQIPVIVVITKARMDQGFRAVVQTLMPRARNVVRVRAIEEVFDDGYTLPPHGLEDLVEVTNEVIPEGQRTAFAAAQKISLRLKVERSQKIIAASATTAAGVAATPLPFSDFIAIVPIQVSMLASISAAFGLPLTHAFLSTLVSSTLTGLGATVSGRLIVAEVVKLFPGGGSITGGVIAAATTAALTTSFGSAYVAALHGLLKNNPDGTLTPEEIVQAFKKQLSREQA
jgi:small GTP-binding protein